MLTVVQGGADSPKKGDKTDRSKSPPKAAAKPEQKKVAADTATAAAAAPKTESKLKKRDEVEMEAKFISKLNCLLSERLRYVVCSVNSTQCF